MFEVFWKSRGGKIHWRREIPYLADTAVGAALSRVPAQVASNSHSYNPTGFHHGDEKGQDRDDSI